MKIAISARTLSGQPRDGIAWFTFEFISRMVRNHPEHTFFLISDKRYQKPPFVLHNAQFIHLAPRNRHPIITVLWHQMLLKHLLRRLKVDIFIGPDGVIPLRCSIPCISVIHDLNHVHRPDDIPFFSRHFYRYYFPRYAKSATRIATVSKFSADDISAVYDIKPYKIDVVYNGVSGMFFPTSEAEADDYRNSLTGGKPYFVFVSNFSPRKNVGTLIKAFDRFRSESGSDYALVLAGGRLYLNDELDRAVNESPYKDSIIFTGRMDREELRKAYGAALAFVFIPWFEGFGIPVIEAMRCGTPCIVSDNSSLPEVSGGAALCVNAADTEACARAMIRIANEPALRRILRDKGIKNSLRFSWDDTAIQMYNSVLNALDPNAYTIF
ncbi:MAG TPA: glycosyltransferase family 1 protein [Bacteroidales bacterium]|nr:glycosyltransferase family 1 protein [Bacteroidales bacterium]